VGVQLSIDDFGTGYSSLAYLQSLPVHELKIDRSFVQNLDSKSGNHVLVAAMVSMAHGLGLSVTAEGVETDAEMQCLQALHVDTLQGYHLGKPMAEKAFEAWRPSLKALPPLATA
jgi:EAL domain-containing protein (putative c-di-GMP-specific phosphodiesterase class I)